jgi:hypothetical protein
MIEDVHPRQTSAEKSGRTVGEDVWKWQHEVDYYERTAHL